MRPYPYIRVEVCSVNRCSRGLAAFANDFAGLALRVSLSIAEKKHLQNRLDHWNSQVSSSDSAIRELQARERDLTAALDAKDAQLAVLRVRLQEADQELTAKRHLVDQLRHENQRCSDVNLSCSCSNVPYDSGNCSCHKK